MEHCLETEEGISEEIEKDAEEVLAALLPSKSKELNETVLLAYFGEKSKKYQSSSLWWKYSMIKKTLLVRKNIDISKYHKLTSFLKNNSVGHEPKKAMVLSKENVIQFLTEAPNEMYLMTKVALVFEIYGACRREELGNMSISDADDKGSVIVVTIPKTKTNKKRVFTVGNDDVVCGLDLYKNKFIIIIIIIIVGRFFFTAGLNFTLYRPFIVMSNFRQW